VFRIAKLGLKDLNGNCKILRIGEDGLRKQKTVQRCLVDKGIALGKRKLIVQRGGFLLTLLTAALSPSAESHTSVEMLR